MICPQCSQKYAPGPTLCWNCRVPQTPESNTNKTLLIAFGSIGVVLVLIFGGLAAIAFRSAQLDARRNAQATQNPQTSAPSVSSNANRTTGFKPNTPTPKPEPTPFECIEGSAYQLTSTKWEKGGFDTVAIWKVTIKNLTSKQLGDFKYRTSYSSETGNVVSKGGVDSLLGKDTIQKIVPPKASRTFEVNDGFVSDEAVRASFEIDDCREL